VYVYRLTINCCCRRTITLCDIFSHLFDDTADERGTAMSVLVQNEVGWIVDHEQEVNKTYAMTHVSEKCRVCDFVTERQKVCQFKAVPDLFAIYRTFVMDSQFTKSMKTSHASDNGDLVMRQPDKSRCELADKSAVSDLQPAAQSKVNIFTT